MNLTQQLEHPALEKHSRNTDKPSKKSISGFHDLRIAPNLVKAIDRLKFITPTPIQEKSIPIAINGDDIIAIAQTGSGKTLAFGIPMLQRLSQINNSAGLVLVPTRELAIQVDEALQSLGHSFKLRTAVLIGGAPMHSQYSAIRRKPHVIIATPGRIMDHIDRGTVDLSNVEVFVLDEADRMLDMGFIPDIRKIIKSIPEERQTLLFSATMPKEISAIAKKLMANPIRIEVDRSGATPSEVSQEMYFISNTEKSRMLALQLKEYTGPTLVFTRTRRMASKLTGKVKNMGFSAAEIHSDRSLRQRQQALEGFKRGKYQVLVATDIAARGIDVSGIELVVNYDMPANSEDYVHRIGRTGRAGKTGHAITFANSEQKNDIRSLERFMKIKLPILALPTLPSEKVLLEEGAKLKFKSEAARAKVFAKRKPSRGKSSRREGFKKKTSNRFSKSRSESKLKDSKELDSNQSKPKSSKPRTKKPKSKFPKSKSPKSKSPKRKVSKASTKKKSGSTSSNSTKSNFKKRRPSKKSVGQGSS